MRKCCKIKKSNQSFALKIPKAYVLYAEW
jgi:hypothetical protein